MAKVTFKVTQGHRYWCSVVNKDLTSKAKDLTLKAKDLTFKAKAKDSKFVFEDTSGPRTKAKDNNTVLVPFDRTLAISY